MTGFDFSLEDLDGPPPPDPELDLVRLTDVEPEDIEWLWAGYLPCKLVVLDGDPGLGKSTISLDFAARVSAAQAWPDGSRCEKGSVLLLSAEDGLADTIRPRLDKAGADTDKVFAITSVPAYGEDGVPIRRPLVLPGDIGRIDAEARRLGDVRLIVVDVLMAYLDDHVDAHKDQAARRALAPLSAMADRLGACVLVLRHLNKTTSTQILYRGGGSIAIIGAARAGYVIGPDPDAVDGDQTRKILACTKMNIAPMPTSRSFRLIAGLGHAVAHVDWLGTSPHTAGDLLRIRSEDDDGDDASDLAAAIKDILADAGGSEDAKKITRELQQAFRCTDRTIRRARTRAGVLTRKIGYGGAWVWYLPDLDPPKGTENPVEDTHT
jgi:hypothetical protein